MKRIRIDKRLASNISDLEDSRPYDPSSDLDCLSDDDILEYDTDDESWDKYLPEVWIDGEGEYILCGGDLSDLLEYLDEHANTVEEVLDILKSVKEKDILNYGYFLPGMIQLCKLLISKNSDTDTHSSESEEDSEETTEPLIDNNLSTTIPLLVNDNFDDILEDLEEWEEWEEV